MIRRAMVLAAGRGTRLAPLTDRLPKPLMPVGGRPLLDHILEFLRAGGIEEVVINLHHLGHAIEAARSATARASACACATRWEDPILDTGGGIKQAEPLLAGEPFVVVNGDSLLELDLRERDRLPPRARRARDHGASARPATRRATALIEIDADDRIRRVAGRPAEASPAPLRALHVPRRCTSSSPRSSTTWTPGAASASSARPIRALLARRRAGLRVRHRRRAGSPSTPRQALAAADATARATPVPVLTHRIGTLRIRRPVAQPGGGSRRRIS